MKPEKKSLLFTIVNIGLTHEAMWWVWAREECVCATELSPHAEMRLFRKNTNNKYLKNVFAWNRF